MMSSTWFLILSTVLYLGICISYVYQGMYWQAVIFGAYALANVGFIALDLSKL